MTQYPEEAPASDQSAPVEAGQAAANQYVRQYLGERAALLAEFERLEAGGNEDVRRVLEGVRQDVRDTYLRNAASLAEEDAKRFPR